MTLDRLIANLEEYRKDWGGDIPVYSDAEWEWELMIIEIREPTPPGPGNAKHNEKLPKRIVLT